MCLLSRYSQYHLSRRPTSYACFELSRGWHYPHVCQLWSHTALQCSVICPRNLPDMDTECYQSIADQFSTCHGATSCIVPDVSGTSLDPCYGTLKYIQVLYSCIARKSGVVFGNKEYNPDCKVHGATMGSIWGRQDPGGPHVGHMNLVTLCMLPHPRQFHTMPSIQFNDW